MMLAKFQPDLRSNVGVMRKTVALRQCEGGIAISNLSTDSMCLFAYPGCCVGAVTRPTNLAPLPCPKTGSKALAADLPGCVGWPFTNSKTD